MNVIQAKLKEVGQSLVPIVIFDAIISMAFIRVDFPVVQRFFIGAILVFIGLSIFLWGVDQSMEPIGYYMSNEIATSSSLLKTIIISFLLGFLVTIAEPDILILGNQVEAASGGSLDSSFLVTMISVGVGVLISISSIRILADRKYNVMMLIIYLIILVMATQVSEEFLAISFDASGATTGALTTPFVLAISVGLSRTKGGKNAEEDSFGMVGAMSTGPILAVMLISIISGQSEIQGAAEPFTTSNDVWGPILADFGPTFRDSLIALIPIVIFFFGYNFYKFKLEKSELISISRGLIYTLIGLTLFLVGAHTGFMDMGRILGYDLADQYTNWLPFIGLVLGMLVVLAEPAVHVLGQQVEDVTAGNIKGSVLRATLSIGVGIAIALSMVRIMNPEVKLWYFLLPGFIISVALSFYVDPIFVGIAYDSGGVASGPMAATFVLAFAQGVADQIPTADVLKDGFGVIAMIAMTPILSIMTLGTINKIQVKRQVGKGEQEAEEIKESPISLMPKTPESLSEVIYAIVDRPNAEEAIKAGRSVGSKGATILHGRDTRSGTGLSSALSMQTEKEMIWFLVDSELTGKIIQAIKEDSKSQGDYLKSIYSLPVTRVSGITLAPPIRPDKEEIKTK